jgi:formylglycine-generating enzyme required for sulfatase activity
MVISMLAVACGARTGLDSLIGDTGVSAADGGQSGGADDGSVRGGADCPPEMAPLAAGDFVLAASGARAHVDEYCIDLNLVTVADYKSCVAAGACISTLGRDTECPSSEGFAIRADHPITCVTHDDAMAYCSWKGKRLPADAEMEWAARNEDAATRFAWGNDVPSAADDPERLCWSAKIARDESCAVGSFPRGRTDAGILDLAGNVSEWTGTAVDSRTNYYVRGCQYYQNWTLFAEAAYRAGAGEAWRDDKLGFRCARNRSI